MLQTVLAGQPPVAGALGSFSSMGLEPLEAVDSFLINFESLGSQQTFVKYVVPNCSILKNVIPGAPIHSVG